MLETLQFNAYSDPQAAEFQVEHPEAPASPIDHREADTGHFLVVSPYTSLSHLLDLRYLDVSQQLLAKALTILESIREDYAAAPYIISFNWTDVFAHLRNLTQRYGHIWRRQHFYIVVFRSQVPATTNRVELGELDQRSHTEAMKSGGLLKYWFGMPDANGRNLATCRRRNLTAPLFLFVMEY